ncbi:MAG TPA: nitroreductase family deazaflavin-dependent oxidoreductase [Candidatus Limnocylindrales bacterium]|nr:nitroreductase family deazaflavin-dependent oxidoreductase [Candidatus Limnocylindrales bacterium]
MTQATRQLPNQVSGGIPRPPSEAPAFVRLSNHLVEALLRRGVPMGPNTFMTVRGRKSGAPRTAAVAVMETAGRRYIIGAYGDVQWVRNLRAAGEATVRLHGRDAHVTAHELDRDEAIAFFGRTLPAYIHAFPWFGRAFARVFFGLVGPEFLNDPEKAAQTRPVFALQID